MNNKVLNILTGKERKRYNQIISLIKQTDYESLFGMDNNDNFGLTNSKYVDRITDLIVQRAAFDPRILILLNSHKKSNLVNKIIRYNANVIENFIETFPGLTDELMLVALDNDFALSNEFINDYFNWLKNDDVKCKLIDSGYRPSREFIGNHIDYFLSVDVMEKLIESGYKPSDYIMNRYVSIFSDEKVITKFLDQGIVPSTEFVGKTNLLDNPNLVDRLLDVIEITPEVLNGELFYGKAKAQQKIIRERPDLLLEINSSSTVFEQFWIEAFKQDYIPEEALKNHFITSNFSLFSRIVKQKPELVKYCNLSDENEKKQIDELALCMGYAPTISDVQNNEYVKKSSRLIQASILRRPESIKYIYEFVPESKIGKMIPVDKFFDLARLAIDNGYIPTLKDIEQNPKLASSFEIMRILIQENPDLINKIIDATQNKEELLKIAIENGFTGSINRNIGSDPYDEKSKSLLYTETAIIYQLENGSKLNNLIYHVNYLNEQELNPYFSNNYSDNLYNYLINKGYQPNDIISLFNGNFDVMKKIISKNPEYITALSNELPRKKIDELGLLAIENGYEPKFEDEIFGYGLEVAKIMVKKYPDYLDKVKLLYGDDFSGEPCELYDEICKISADAGFIPDVEKMGDGWGRITTTKYNYSYDIMKKVIPLKPELIDSCKVEDKDQYDELCRLALSFGYEVRDFVLNRGSKICSNYEIMASYITSHPNFLLNVEITDSDEMLKLIDIAINSGLVLSDLGQKQLFRLFSLVDDSKWADYLDINTIDSLQKAKTLVVNNDEVSKTLNPNFLSDEITCHFTEKQIEILSCYPNLQKKIIEVSSSDVKSKIIYELVSKYEDNLEWIPILENVLDNINSSEFASLLDSIKDQELSSEENNNLFYMLMTNNHLDITSYDELRNIDTIRENYINMLIERNTLGSLKTAYFERTFGIDLVTATNLVELYGKSLESSTIDSLDEKSRSEFVILENMKKIIGLNNIDVLKYYVENINPEFIVKPDLMVTYEARIKYLFTQEFNKSFTKPVSEDKVVSNIDGEQDLDIYLAAGHDGKKKCRMMITSIGAYTGMEEPDDYYASWNVDKIASHGCCCSYVGEKNLGTAEIKYCCLGFTDYELGSLQLSAPYDLCSSSIKDSYQIAAYFSSMYLLPDDVLDYTRHTHNETVWERRCISGDGMFKKQPSYIVYFVDNFEDRLMESDAMKQWESVKKAAADFSIEIDGVKKSLPIMVVEREKIAKSQIEIIQSKLNEFKMTLDSRLIKEIVTDYESNYAGNREYHLNISEKYFPKHSKLSESVVGEVIETIKNTYETNPTMAIKCINEIEKVVRSEQEKYNNTEHGVGQSLPSFDIEEALMSINELKSKFMKKKNSTLDMISNCDGNERQYERSDLSTMSPEFLDCQLTSSEVTSVLKNNGLKDNFVRLENEINDEKINERLKVHGKRHIKNVLLYSTLIGQSVIDNQHDLDLIMLSAKYHDVGRRTDAHEEHAESSARIARDELKEQCTAEDLAVISTIIEFHETPRNAYNVDEQFLSIAKKNGVSDERMSRVREMAEVLKDADALDRTRFINRARLNPKFLQYDFSKRLVKFASTLQETYAISDLNEFQCDAKIGMLMESYTPQEVLRTIRLSTRGGTRSLDVSDFVSSWAETQEKKSEELDSMLNDTGETLGEGVKNGKK